MPHTEAATQARRTMQSGANPEGALQIGPSNPLRLLRVFEVLAVLVLVSAVLIGAVVVEREKKHNLAEAQSEALAQIERAQFDFNLLIRRALPLMKGLQRDPMFQAALGQSGSTFNQAALEQLLAGVLYRNPMALQVRWLDGQGIPRVALDKQGRDVVTIDTRNQRTALHPFEAAQLVKLQGGEFVMALENNPKGLSQLWFSTPWHRTQGAPEGYLVLSVQMPRLDALPFRPVNDNGPPLRWYDHQGHALGMTADQIDLPRAAPDTWAAMQSEPMPGQLWRRVSLAQQNFDGLTITQAPDLFVLGQVDEDKLHRLYQKNLQTVALLCFLGALGTLLALLIAYRLLDQVVRLRRHEARVRKTARMGYWQLDVPSGVFKASIDVWRTQGSTDPGLFTLHDFLDGFAPAQRERFHAEIARITQAEDHFEMEVLYTTRAQTEMWISIHAQSYLRQGERPVIEGSIQNITERKTAELARESLREFVQSVIDLSHLAVFEIDVPRGERRCNKHLFQLLGLPIAPENEFAALDFDALVHPDDLPGLLEQRRGYIDGALEIYRMPFRVRHAEGHWVWLYGEGKVVSRDAQGRALLIRGVHMDISEIAKARESAEQASRVKSEFLSRMSHELRSPLNSILGYAQALEFFGDLNEQQQDHVSNILGGGRHLLNLVNDLLQLTRVQSGAHETITRQPLALAPVVAQCCGLVRPQANERSMTLVQDLQDGEWVMADALRIKQVILNLLSNAIKYGNPETPVFVSSRRLSNGQLRLSVRDSGPGIASDVGDKVFEPFYRGQLHQFGYEGAGIGLSVSKQLVEAMQGRISYESTLGVGSVFHIDLVAARSPVSPVTPVSAASDVQALQS